MKIIARWQTRQGKQWIELCVNAQGAYSYRGSGQGGALPSMPSDDAAIAYMERPWDQGAGPVTVLQTDYPSVKRT